MTFRQAIYLGILPVGWQMSRENTENSENNGGGTIQRCRDRVGTLCSLRRTCRIAFVQFSRIIRQVYRRAPWPTLISPAQPLPLYMSAALARRGGCTCR